MTESVDQPPSSPPRPKLTSGFMTRIGFEFMVVFLGVWGALWAENRREEAQDRENAIRIAEGILHTIDRGVLEWGGPYLNDRQRELVAWRESYGRGERPIPFFFTVPGAERGTPEIWDAALAAGILEVLDPALASDVGAFIREYDGHLIRIGRYHVRVEELIYPGLEEGADWFYKTGSSGLKPEFAGLVLQADSLLVQWDRRITMARERRDSLAVVVSRLRR